MLKVFFNPYTGCVSSIDIGKERLLATANACRSLSLNPELKMHDFSGIDSLKYVTIVKDAAGALFATPALIRYFKGHDKDLIVWFFRQFDKGIRISDEELSNCQGWTLRQLQVSVPALEYAFRQDGMAITISDDQVWHKDFFVLDDGQQLPSDDKILPNIYGQIELGTIQSWIEDWRQRNLDFKKNLETQFNIIFCPGSTNYCFPTNEERRNVTMAFEDASQKSYQVDGNLIKYFWTKFGSIFELRSYGDGYRVFYALHSGRPAIGGFYRKSDALDQTKAGENAAFRLHKEGYI